MFSSNVTLILDVTTVLVCFALAAVLFRVSTAGSVARKLSVLLIVEGITILSSGIELDLFAFFFPETMSNLPDDALWVTLSYKVHTAGDCAMLALYPGFLAAALNTKLTRPFAGKRATLPACK